MNHGGVREVAKRMLVRAGARLPERALYELNGVMNYLEAGNWMRRHGYEPETFADDKVGVFRKIAERRRGRQTLYLEFGVAHGASMREWTRLLDDPRDRLHGFDSFEGLPMRWLSTREKGHYDRGGEPPPIDDDRLSWFVGWFDETLPRYEWPEHEWLVVNLDADLYTSTRIVLDHVRGHLASGSVLYFDEFNHRADELRAFDDFLGTTHLEFDLLAASRDFAHVAFELR